MINTADDYYALVSTFDQRRIDEEIARIPLNVNRAGKHYKRLIQKIYDNQKQINLHRPKSPYR